VESEAQPHDRVQFMKSFSVPRTVRHCLHTSSVFTGAQASSSKDLNISTDFERRFPGEFPTPRYLFKQIVTKTAYPLDTSITGTRLSSRPNHLMMSFLKRFHGVENSKRGGALSYRVWQTEKGFKRILLM
jgi:hypothetical protein